MNIDMNQVITGVTIVKACSVKPDKDSTDSKQVNVAVKFDGAALKAVFDKAVSQSVIAWQNGVGRKTFDTLKAGQTINIQFTAPASRGAVDPKTATIATLKNMSKDEQRAYLLELAKAAGMSEEDTEEAIG